MSSLMNMSQKQIISSLDFRNMVNEARKSVGEVPVRNTHFLERVQDELEGELSVAKLWQPLTGGTPQRYYDLTLEQCMLVGMRESKAVRRSVLAKLKELEVKKPRLPDFTNPYESALAWASEYKAKEEALLGKAEAEHKLEVAAPKIIHYDTVVERTNLINATQLGTKIGLSAQALNKQLDLLGVYNKSVSRSKVFRQWFIDKGYGEVKQTNNGFTQSLFTMKGEAWVIKQLSPIKTNCLLTVLLATSSSKETAIYITD